MAQNDALIDKTISNDGFWPDLPARDLIEGWRLVADARDFSVLQAICSAMVECNDRLVHGKTVAIALGYTTLEDYAAAVYPDDEINGGAVLMLLYLQAVGNLAKSKLQRIVQAQNRKLAQETDKLEADFVQSHFLDESQIAIARILRRMTDGIESADYGVHVGLVGETA